MKFLVVLLALATAPTLAMAHQGSVSFDCSTNKIVEINLEGVTFFTAKLASEGYTASVVNNVLDLNRGTQSIAIGTLQKPGACSIGMGYYTSFVNFDNANLALSSDVNQLTGCFDVNTDGMYGINQLTTINLVTIDNGLSMTLTLQYTQGYNSLGACQADLKQK